MFKKLLRLTDSWLNGIAMYRLVLYVLIAYVAIGALLAWIGWLPFSPINLILTSLYIIAVCYAGNAVFAWGWEVESNEDSVLITALILALIIAPLKTEAQLPFITAAAGIAMVSKYMFAWGRKHVFNPAAVGVALAALAAGSANWWVGSAVMLPYVLIGGLLIVRKIRRYVPVVMAVLTTMVIGGYFGVAHGFNLLDTWQKLLFNSPLIFMTTIMLTEPFTLPPRKWGQALDGMLVGFLFVPQVNILGYFFTPEMALLAGNLLAYVLSPKRNYSLTFQRSEQVAPDVYDFVFAAERPFNFKPGQYMEFTVGHTKWDNRGIRRYFTIASAPAEPDVRIGVKFYDQASSFKLALADLKAGQTIMARQLGGDFTLPADVKKPIVMIAGGIGVTPFRSQVADMLAQNAKRPVTLFYEAKTIHDFPYVEIFEEAREKLDMQTVYVVSDKAVAASDWHGEKGHVSPQMLAKYVPDAHQALFYISGPQAMVTTVKNTLRAMGVPRRHIHTDYFPGLA
jgi:ferredoxin-NADP reductase